MANTDFVMGSNIDLGGLYQLLGALIEKRTADPGSPAQGQIWCRTDTSPPKIKWYDGTSTQILADLASVVNSVAAGDTTITIGGTATAPTVKVAKVLDHTWITDFDTQVRISRLDQMAAPTAAVSFNNQNATNLSDPVAAQDAVNLRTLQALVNALDAAPEAQYATAAALPANAYANGASGVGATLTASANAALSVDGVAVAVGDVILVQNEVAGANNGLYTVTATGSGAALYVLTRHTAFDQAAEVLSGRLVAVKAPTGRTAGTNNDSKVFVSVVASPSVLGTSAIVFSLIGSTYSAGTGLTLTGTTFSLTAPVTVALGGTNATTATGARQSLVVPTMKYFTIGNAAATSFVCNHALNNTKPTVNVRRISDGAQIDCQNIVTDANNLTVYIGTSGTPIGTNTHIVTITGVEGVG